MYYTITLWMLLVLLVGAAFWRAQRPEAAAILLFLTAGLLSVAVTPRSPGTTPLIAGELLAIDLAVMIGLGAIAIRYQRRWAMLATALQIIANLAHFARLIDPTFDVVTYGIMESVSSVPQLILLSIAIWRHSRRKESRSSLPS